MPQHLHLKNVISLQKIQMFSVSDLLAATGSDCPHFDGKIRIESVFLKKWLLNPLKKGHCNQRCAAASGRARPHPALIEVNEDFIADFVGTDSGSPSLCQCAFKVPSAALHASQELTLTNSDQDYCKTNIAVASRS